MAKFLIEVPHEAETIACAKAIKILFESGSHFITNADFGCLDGVHKSWLVVEVDGKDEARNLVPAAYRRAATVVALNRFSDRDIDELLKHHNS